MNLGAVSIVIGIVVGLLVIAEKVPPLFGWKSIKERLEQYRARADRKSDEPIDPQRFRTLREQLARLRISASPELENLDRSQTARLGDPKIIVGKVLEGDFTGFRGFKPDRVVVLQDTRSGESLPDYLLDWHQQIELNATEYEKRNNQNRVLLTKCEAPIIDDGSQVELTTRKTDWFMRRAYKENIHRLQADIMDGRLSLRTLPRPLDANAVVITADQKIVLVHRGERVKIEPNTWSVPGEQMDADKDYDPVTDSFSPAKTIQRLLTEYDELNLPKHLVSPAKVEFFALATEWHMLLANLIAIVRLNEMTSVEVQNYFQKGEHDGMHFVDFGSDPVEQFLRLASNGATLEVPWKGNRRDPINDITRFSILSALFNRFGYPEMMYQVARRSR